MTKSLFDYIMSLSAAAGLLALLAALTDWEIAITAVGGAAFGVALWWFRSTLPDE